MAARLGRTSRPYREWERPGRRKFRSILSLNARCGCRWGLIGTRHPSGGTTVPDAHRRRRHCDAASGRALAVLSSFLKFRCGVVNAPGGNQHTASRIRDDATGIRLAEDFAVQDRCYSAGPSVGGERIKQVPFGEPGVPSEEITPSC